jgi:hypothetical protein
VTPHAELLHHESASRGYEFSPPRRQRVNRERQAMRAAWNGLLDDNPFFTPMLSLSPPFRQLADPPRRPLPWRVAERRSAS